jgi:metallo-beta-lactamase class B
MRFAVTLLFSIFSLMQVLGQERFPKLQIHHLTDNFYIYTTYRDIDGKPFPANGMYLIAEDGAVLFDTPWDTTQLQPLLDTIAARHDHEVVFCIATHYHADRTAGLEYLNKKGIPTFTSKQTYDLCAKQGEKQASNYFVKDTVFKVCRYHLNTFYPGEGHTADNIVVWVEKENILYGGCFVKSTDNQSLGNIADANLKAWVPSLEKVKRRFPNPAYIVPGHFRWGSKDALDHTIRLLKQAGKKG